ncbi:MAG: transglutaminase-like domain-containing protein [Dehalococcoidia bacterium]
MKKQLVIHLFCGVLLGALIVSGLGCVIQFEVVYREGPLTTPFGITESEIKTLVTPECPVVNEYLQIILDDDSPYEPSQDGFDDIRDWVAITIDYMSDDERWGDSMYWQAPEQTLALRTGDCKDFSILLISFLRAYGIDAEQVYVVLGVDDEGYGHAFLKENWYHDGEWRRIEPQAPAELSSWHPRFGTRRPHPDSELDKYEIIVAFNDLYYYDESFPWD